MSNMDTISAEWVSVKTLARLLDISEKTIWDWLYKARRHPTLDPLPYHKLGGLVRFNQGEVRAWVARRKVRPALVLAYPSRPQSTDKFVK